jgi:hypothetical protein
MRVVLTDGESQPVAGELTRAFKRRPRIETIFVHVWGPGERIFETGVAEGGYRPDPRSGTALARAASLVGGQVFAEGEETRAVGAVRAAIGEGKAIARNHESGRLALMPYLTLAALLPLGLVLLRRNVWWRPRSALRGRRERTRRPEVSAHRRVPVHAALSAQSPDSSA